jgi:hypothetical protein
VEHELIDAMAASEHDEPVGDRLSEPPLERSHHTWPGAPGDVEARHRVAVAGREAASALRPADHGKEPDAQSVQPRALLTRRELHVGVGPCPRPAIRVAVEAGATVPVLPGELGAVADTHPLLLRRVHQEQPAERPVSLTTDVRVGFLFEQDHPAPGLGELCAGDQAGQAGSNDDRICIHACDHRRSSPTPKDPALKTL